MKRRAGVEPSDERAIPVAVIGSGRLARVLLPRLAPAGYPPVGILVRRPSSVRSIRRMAPQAIATTRPGRALRDARVVLVAVRDREIEPLARKLAELDGIDWRRKVVLHHSGVSGTEPLTALASRGAAVGVLHPLVACGDPDRAGELLPGARARIEGDRRGGAAARRLAKALGLVPFRGRGDPVADARQAYHAAASLLSNDLLALLSIGVELFESAGIEPREALDGLVRLAQGTLQQAARGGLRKTLTGPVVRGDVETLKAQISALEAVGDAADIHRLLSLRLTEIDGLPLSPTARRRIRRAIRAAAGSRSGRRAGRGV